MKTTLARFAAVWALSAAALISPAYAQVTVRNNISSSTTTTYDPGKDEENAAKKDNLRVIFLANSTYDNFRIAMENGIKKSVNIEVTDEQGAIVHTERVTKVSKRIKEMDLSFLKRGAYSVRVFDDKNEFSKKVIIP